MSQYTELEEQKDNALDIISNGYEHEDIKVKLNSLLVANKFIINLFWFVLTKRM